MFQQLRHKIELSIFLILVFIAFCTPTYWINWAFLAFLALLILICGNQYNLFRHDVHGRQLFHLRS